LRSPGEKTGACKIGEYEGIAYTREITTVYGAADVESCMTEDGVLLSFLFSSPGIKLKVELEVLQTPRE